MEFNRWKFASGKKITTLCFTPFTIVLALSLYYQYFITHNLLAGMFARQKTIKVCLTQSLYLFVGHIFACRPSS